MLPLSADYETLAVSDEFTAVKSTLIAFNEELAAQGAQLVVVYIPSKEHVLWSRIWDPEDVNNVLERTVTGDAQRRGFRLFAVGTQLARLRQVW
ncbi:MAG: hypothetical protein R3D55_00670 [Chloroflexota bacterium]